MVYFFSQYRHGMWILKTWREQGLLSLETILVPIERWVIQNFPYVCMQIRCTQYWSRVKIRLFSNDKRRKFLCFSPCCATRRCLEVTLIPLSHGFALYKNRIKKLMDRYGVFSEPRFHHEWFLEKKTVQRFHQILKKFNSLRYGDSLIF